LTTGRRGRRLFPCGQTRRGWTGSAVARLAHGCQQDGHAGRGDRLSPCLGGVAGRRTGCCGYSGSGACWRPPLPRRTNTGTRSAVRTIHITTPGMAEGRPKRCATPGLPHGPALPLRLPALATCERRPRSSSGSNGQHHRSRLMVTAFRDQLTLRYWVRCRKQPERLTTLDSKKLIDPYKPRGLRKNGRREHRNRPGDPRRVRAN
jgi:hypothetical protein